MVNMKEISNDYIKPIESKIAKLSVEMLYGRIKNAQELAKRVEEDFPTPEDRIFALTLLIVNKYMTTTQTVLDKIKNNDNDKKDLMFG